MALFLNLFWFLYWNFILEEMIVIWKWDYYFDWIYDLRLGIIPVLVHHFFLAMLCQLLKDNLSIFLAFIVLTIAPFGLI